MMKAPASPARMRPTVASTSLNWLQLEKMSMQRLKTSISEGNRNGGKNSEAICDSFVSGSLKKPSGRTAPFVQYMDVPSLKWERPWPCFWM